MSDCVRSCTIVYDCVERGDVGGVPLPQYRILLGSVGCQAAPRAQKSPFAVRCSRTVSVGTDESAALRSRGPHDSQRCGSHAGCGHCGAKLQESTAVGGGSAGGSQI
eukprot:gene77-biopygen1839